MDASSSPPWIEWGASVLALPGEVESGDLHAARVFPDGAVLAAVDGLGHGRDAAAAARLAVAILEAHAREPLLPLLRRCHEKLKGTRGVVLSLAWLDVRENVMTWLGVGNVEGVLVRANPGEAPPRKRLVPAPGVVGSRLPALHPRQVALQRGDLLIFGTDGIDVSFAEAPIPNGSPEQIARRIRDRFARNTDDALVLVARYLGGGGGSA